jgi:drug/metabolite transporter (DMT)-like permease
MQKSNLASSFMLLTAAAIWGFAFVAQKKGMDYVGPFTFNSARYLLGTLSILPLVLYFRNKRRQLDPVRFKNHSLPIKPAILLGALLFLGTSFQQVGLVTADAGKSGFITGMYVLFVPVFGLLLAKKVKSMTWLAVVIALSGLYLLGVKASAGNFWVMEQGDFLVLCSAVFWALHVLTVDRLVRHHDALELSILQFGFCTLFSLSVALGFETIEWQAILAAAQPILYVGILSTGVAFTLQVIAQKKVHPTHAAIIMSTEGVFAVIGGVLILKEIMTGRMLFGCGLILIAMIMAQLPAKKSKA